MSGWVCLMYHDVSPEPAHADGSGQYFSVSRSAFERQLDQLADLGYRVCSVEEAVNAPKSDRRLIACSFDDGDAGQFERGFPALAKRNMSATFFITTGWVGTPNYVTWDALREMKAGGMSLQSHTRTHPFLSQLDDAALRRELRESRDELDAELAQRTTSIALPGGDPPRRSLSPLFTEAGYSIVATSRWGVNASGPRRGSEPTWINRCTIRGEMSPALFHRIAVADPWLSGKRRLREGVLRALRNSLGPTRYARWRRRFLNGHSNEDAT